MGQSSWMYMCPATFMPWVQWRPFQLDVDPQREVSEAEDVQLAVHLREAVSEVDLQRIDAFIALVPQGNDNLVNKVRNFGEDKQHEGGHRMTFLHKHVEERFPELVDLLWSIGRSADARAAWGVGAHVDASSLPRPGLRCLEAITYDAADVPADTDAGYSSLGWHADGHTLVTLAVPLATSSRDFEGGELDFRQRTAGTHDQFRYQSVSALRRGDAVAWRGWDEHRVRAVRAGTRRVLVAEFWSGPSVEEAQHQGNPRRPDNEAGYRAALAIDPHAVDMRMRFANMLKEGKKVRAAIEEYKLAIAADPRYSSPRTRVGLLYDQLGQHQEALREYDIAQELNPHDAKNLNNKARTLFALGDYASSAASMDAALALTPLDAGIWRNLGVLQRKRGEDQKALEAFQTALRLDPDDATGHLTLAELAEERGDLAEAELRFRGSARAEPKNPKPLVLLGAFLGRQDRFQEACEPLRLALGMDPKNKLASEYLQFAEEFAAAER